MQSILIDLTKKYPALEVCVPELQAAFHLLRDSYQNGGKLLICGNGGSAADSEHIVGELMKGFWLRRPIPDADRQKLVEAFPERGEILADRLQGALPAISLVSQSSLISAFANDVDPEMIFAQQVYGYGRPGDVVLGISTSGNSGNVLQALQVGQALGLKTVGLTGETGGKMASVCDVTICAPYQATAEVQEAHLALYHALCGLLEEAFFDK